MKTVLVTLPVEERHKEILEAAGAGCRFVRRNFCRGGITERAHAVSVYGKKLYPKT